LDLPNYSPRAENTTDDAVNEGSQPHDTNDESRKMVERE
jgi:hypothetical protein